MDTYMAGVDRRMSMAESTSLASAIMRLCCWCDATVLLADEAVSCDDAEMLRRVMWENDRGERRE
ncbi:unnamed protein product, partial [Ilex paraguariensis]